MMIWNIWSAMTAMIGEKSKPPKGGIILLKISKYQSVDNLIAFIGWASQSIVGIQVKNILIMIRI